MSSVDTVHSDTHRPGYPIGELAAVDQCEVEPRILGNVPAQLPQFPVETDVGVEIVGNSCRGDTKQRPQQRQHHQSQRVGSVFEYEDSGGELLKMVERKHKGRYDVVEIFSPPRVCEKARE